MYSNYRFMLISLVSIGVTANTPETVRNLSLKVGETQRIELPSNRTTGYSWVPTKNIAEDQIISLVKSGYEPKKTRVMGSGGMQYWEIKGKAKGTTTLTLEYKRPWVKEEKPTKIQSSKFQYVINVE